MSQDKRKIAVYARKSKITESGKSIENQITKCKAYAVLKFDDLTEDDILVYQDEGLSGFYSDRPNYQRMLGDIQSNKIKAVICYKFDRISRRTLDLLNLVEQLRVKKIAFISCTDEVDTSSRTGKIVMSLLASIAEFERDIIAERISDNMYELAKEGRWLGGITPTGFYSKKEHILVAGHKKTVNHLEPVEEEQEIVRHIYSRFLQTKSVQRVVDELNETRVQTKNQVEHTRVSVKNILTNPVYAVADERMYDYLSALEVPIYAPRESFDDIHGLMVYNKTEQTKEVSEDSTAIHPQYTKKTMLKDKKDWIAAVGAHKGLISGRDWMNAQTILLDNRDKYSRPNEKTQSLLSGIIACPYCGKNLYTHRETGRYTNGLPRFLYKCQTKRGNPTACVCKDVKGVEVDQFILDTLSEMGEKNSAYFYKLLENQMALQSASSTIEDRLGRVQNQINRLQRDINQQTVNLRQANEVVQPILLEDLQRLIVQQNRLEDEAEEIRSEKKSNLSDQDMLEKIRMLVTSFPTLIKELSYQEKMEMVRKVVEKVFVVPNEEGEDEVHLFIKGTPAEEYDDFFQMEPERGDVCKRGERSIFNTPACIRGEFGALFAVEGGNGLNQPNRANGD